MTTHPRPVLVAIFVGACLALTASACTSDAGAGASAVGGITVQRARIEAPPNPATAAVRMVVHNTSDRDDALLSVSTPVAKAASVHRSTTDSLGRSTMELQPRLRIPARSSVTFAPNGLHVMLTGISDDLAVGDSVPLTLVFEDAGKVRATATVVEFGAEESHDHG